MAITKKRTFRSILSLVLTICMLLGLLPAIAPVEASAANVLLGDSYPSEGSIRVNIQDNGIVAQMNRYTGGAWMLRPGYSTIATYCTTPSIALWIDGTRYASNQFENTAPPVGSGRVSLANPVGTQTTTTSGSTTTVTTSWSFSSGTIQLRWIVTYTDGNSYFNHRWEIDNNTSTSWQNVRLYYGGHHQLGGANAGWGNYIGLSDMAYTWMDYQSGMTYLKGVGGTNADHSSHYYARRYDAVGAGGYTANQSAQQGRNLTDETSPPPATATHTSYYLQWTLASTDSADSSLPAYGRTIDPGDTYSITAQEGIAPPGYIIAVPDGDIRAPQGVTVAHTFTLYNIHTAAVTVNLSLSGYAWSSWFDGVLPGNGTSVIVPANGSTAVTVYVTVPQSAVDNDIDRVTLDGTYILAGNTETVSESANTIADSTIPYISAVTAGNTRDNLNVTVDYRNLSGSNPTTIELFDSTGTSVVATVPIVTQSIPSGGTISNINVSSLPEGTYTIKASVLGIEYPHNTTQFTLTDAGVIAYTWRDINSNNSMDTFEGIRDIDLTFVSISPSAPNETQTSGAGGLTIFGTPVKVGGEYVVYPTLDTDTYALDGITATVGNTQYTANIVAGDNDPVFEFLTLNATYNGVPAVRYKYRSAVKPEVTFKFKLALAAVIAIYPHTGTATPPTPPSSANYVYGGSAEVTYISSGGTPITAGSGTIATAADIPSRLSVAAGTDPTITFNAPRGYRMANNMQVSEARTRTNLGPHYTQGDYLEFFRLIAGDIRFTGVSGASSSQSQAANSASIDTPLAQVAVDVTTWTGVNTQLDFDVWDSNLVQTSNPTPRTNYTWTLVDDPNGIMQSNSFTPTGTFTFSGQTGTARVRVTTHTNPAMSHEMDIVASTLSTATFNKMYFAYADDPTLTEVTHYGMIQYDTRDFVIVGENTASGDKTKLPHASLSLLVSDFPNIATIVPVAGDMYKVRLTGVNRGSLQLFAHHPNYNGTPVGTGAAYLAVLVTNTSLVGATMKITPDPISVPLFSTIPTPNLPPTVTYTLYFADSTSMTVIPQFFDEVTSPSNIATVMNSYVFGYVVGTTTLTATFMLDPNIKDTSTIIVSSGGMLVTPTGPLKLAESTSTGGFIEQANTADYFAYFDTNGDGAYDSGDTILPYGTPLSSFASANNSFSVGAGTAPNARLTGVTPGVDKLTVTYDYGGTLYTASADIVVYSSGYSYNKLDVSPAVTVLDVGDEITYTVSAVFTDSANNTESHVLPVSMYAGSITSGPSFASLVSGTQNKVRATASTGEAVYRATLVSDASRTGDAKILVIPAGAYLEVTPDPQWIEKGTSESINYQLLSSSGASIAIANLTDYVFASIANTLIAQFGTGITPVAGVDVGRTTLTAYLYGRAVSSKTVTIYVWDDTSNGGSTGLMWNPSSLTISVGNSGSSTVHLINTDGSRGAAVSLEHLSGLTIANNSIATIPTAPTGTALTVTAGNVSANSSTKVTATSPAGSADLTVNVTTNVTVSGIAASPQIIELWPGEMKTVTVKNTGTGQLLDAAQLASLGQTLSNVAENNVTVVSGGLEIEQAAVPSGGSVNVLELTHGTARTVVYIINYTRDPYQSGVTQTLELILNPDPTWVELGGGTADVAAVLTLTDDTSGALIDTITLPAETVSWAANTSAATMPGRIALAKATATNQTLMVTGQAAGAQTYTVTYSGGLSPITTTGNVFVFARSVSNITNFRFEPETVVLTPNATQGIVGIITYSNGSEQRITANEIPIAIENLRSNDPATATVSANGTIRGQSLGTDSARITYIEGKLIATLLSDIVEVLVYDPNAAMTISPNPVVVYIPGGTPNTESIATNIGTFTVPNVFLTYTASNGNITLSSGPASDEYTVAGVTEGTATITSLLKMTTKSVTANVEVRGLGSYYTVDYDANTGSGIMPSYTVASGSIHTVQPNGFTPPTPTDGFVGWNTAYDGSGTSYSIGAQLTVTGNITLYAQWSPTPPASYTVTYDENGGSGTMSPDTVAAGTAYTVRHNAFTPPMGKHFVEWNTMANGGGISYEPGGINDSFTVNSDVTLYAIWEDLYTVSYDPNNGTGTMPSYTNVQGTVYTVDANGFTEPSGMQFKEWNTASDGSGTTYNTGDTFALTADITLYAIWEPAPVGTVYTVTYDANGATSGSAPVDGSSYSPGSTLQIPGNTGGLVNTGFTFAGWAENSITGAVYQAGDTYVISSNTTFYAVWTPNVPGTTYSVTYDANGATSGAVPVDNNLYTPGNNVIVMGNTGNLDNTGLVFVGWATNNAGTGTIYQAGNLYAINADTTFYAVWCSATAQYTLTVWAGTGGSVNTAVNGLYNVGDTIAITATPAPGYTFSGWIPTVGGVLDSTSNAIATVTMPANNVTIVANFTLTSGTLPPVTPATRYTVTYTANGGIGSDFVVTGIASGTSHTILTSATTGHSRGDYEFIGWNTSANGRGISYSPGETIIVNSDVTLYAQWKIVDDGDDNGGNGGDVGDILDTENHIVYLNGYSDGSVRPDNAITRAETAMIFYRLLKAPGTAAGSKFSDVKGDEWFAQAVNYLASIGILSGYPDGTFQPNAQITRAEFTAIATRFAELSTSARNAFSDVRRDHWAIEYINSAYAYGWIGGYPDGTFRAENKITRAEVVKIVNAMLIRRIDQVALQSVNNPFNDVTGSHWAYAEIIEAAIAHNYMRDANAEETWHSW